MQAVRDQDTHRTGLLQIQELQVRIRFLEDALRTVIETAAEHRHLEAIAAQPSV